jgi:hypothetical protein
MRSYANAALGAGLAANGQRKAAREAAFDAG